MATLYPRKRFLLCALIAGSLLLLVNISRAQEDVTAQFEADTLSSFESRITALIDENTILKRKLKDFEARPSEYSGDSSFSGASGSEMAQLKEKNDALSVKVEEKNKEINDLREYVARLEKDRGVIAESHTAISQLKEEKSSLQAQLGEKEKENGELEKRLSALEKENDRLMNESAALERLKGTVNSLQEEKTTLLSHLDEKAKEGDELRGQLAAVKEAMSAKELEKSILESMLKKQVKELRRPQLAGADEENFDKIIHQNLGFSYGMKGNIDEAIQEYQNALESSPDDKDIHYNLGYLFTKKNSYPEAIEEYKKALKGLPQDKEIYYNVAILYATALNDLTAAQEYYQKFLSLSSSSEQESSPQSKKALKGN